MPQGLSGLSKLEYFRRGNFSADIGRIYMQVALEAVEK
jgi:hypothetical protein